MNKIALPRDFIYEFYGDKTLVSEYLNQCLASNIHYDKSADHSAKFSSFGYPIPYNSKIQDWFADCINKVSQEYFNLSDDAKLTINDIWITKTNFLEYSSAHNHAWSIFSGLLYLDNSEAETIFYVEDEVVKRYVSLFGLVSKKTQTNIYSVKPELGKLVIWPSYIQHKIAPSKQKNSRYTIAFNTFFDGKVSNVDTQRLSIKTSPPDFLT